MISFIIPAHNEEKLIARTLQSIFEQQTREPYEVIVVDNNSTDATRKIVSEKFPHVRLLMEKNQGTTWARNRGAKEAQGNILAFFDADVEVPPDWSKKILTYFAENKSLVAVTGPYYYSNLNAWHKFWEYWWYYCAVIPNKFIFENILHLSSQIIGGNFAVQKKAFQNIGGFDTRYVFWGDDADLAKRLIKHGKIFFRMDLGVHCSSRGLIRNDSFLLETLFGAKTILEYGLNFYWVAFFNRPFSKRIKVVR